MEGIATHLSCIDTIIREFKDNLSEVQYGEVGLIFTLHNSAVTKVRKIKAVKMKLSGNGGKADVLDEAEEIHYPTE